MIPNFKKLVLSGGGPRGLAILGALHYASENNLLLNISEYYGTSVGSVLCALLMVGYTPFEIFHQFLTQDKTVDRIDVDIRGVLTLHGLCQVEEFGKKVNMYIIEKLGYSPTFKELYKETGKKLHIIGTNTEKLNNACVCFSVDTYPDLRVVEAIEISCDMPFIFSKKTFNGENYVDGGIINNYAIDLADDGVTSVLGIYAFGTEYNISGSEFVNWIYRLLHIPILEVQRLKMKYSSNKCTHLELNITDLSFIEFNPSRKKKVAIFSNGYRQAKEFFTKDPKKEEPKMEMLSSKILPPDVTYEKKNQ